MPAIIPLILSLIGAEAAQRGGTALLRRLFMTGGKSVTQKLAAGAAEQAGKRAAAQAADALLAKATTGAPAWLASRANVGTLARNAVEFGSSAGKLGLATGGMIAVDHLMPGIGSNIDHGKSVEGWEMFQGQMAPGQANQMAALTAVEQDAQRKHLQRALDEYVAYQRESGGLI